MDFTLSQCDVEWLRCRTISQRLTPILPEDVLKKFEGLGLVTMTDAGGVVTAAATKSPSMPAPAFGINQRRIAG